MEKFQSGLLTFVRMSSEEEEDATIKTIWGTFSVQCEL